MTILDNLENVKVLRMAVRREYNHARYQIESFKPTGLNGSVLTSLNNHYLKSKELLDQLTERQKRLELKAKAAE